MSSVTEQTAKRASGLPIEVLLVSVRELQTYPDDLGDSRCVLIRKKPVDDPIARGHILRFIEVSGLEQESLPGFGYFGLYT